MTLIELLVGLSLLALLGGLAVATVEGPARSGAHAVAVLDVARTTSTTGALLRQELRDADSLDVSIASGTRLMLARPVGDAAVCGTVGSALLILRADWSGARLPEAAHDQAWVLVDPLGETWDSMAIAAVGTGQCPADGSPALRLTLPAPVVNPLMVRVVEPTELSVYRSGTADWLGLAPADGSASVQPFAGPLRAGASHFNRFGAALHLFVAMSPLNDTTIVIPLGSPP